MYGYIYKTTNTLNGKTYIGQKKGLFNPRYKGSGQLLIKKIKQYGRKNFKVEIICYLPTKEHLDEFEKFIIEKYKEILGKYNLYNISVGGSAPMAGRKHSNLSRLKMSASHIGDKNHNFGKSVCAGTNNPNFGNKWTDEQKKNLSRKKKGIKNPKNSISLKGRIPWNKGIKGAQIAWNKGIPCSEEMKKKISDGRKRALYVKNS